MIKHRPEELDVLPGGVSRPVSEVLLGLTARALALGFSRLTVASPEPFETERYEEFLRRNYHGSMDYLALRDDKSALLRKDPRSVFETVASVICVALPYPAPLRLRASRTGHEVSVPSTEPALRGKIASYAQGSDYHGVMKEKLLLLADGLAAELGRTIVARACVDTAPLLERDLAQRSGLSFTGKNTLALTPGLGSHYVLGELLVDVALPPTKPEPKAGCGSCTACLSVCPTEAFVGPYVLDARRCISYLTIESSEDIPRDLRAKLGTWVFGCDLCQAICPFNHGASSRKEPRDLAPLDRLTEPDLLELLTLTSSGYKRLVKGTALRRASRSMLARNAAVALGNTGRAEAIGPLAEAARSHSSLQVQKHALWALGRLGWYFGHAEARDIVLEFSGAVEPVLALEARLWAEETPRTDPPTAGA